MRRGDWSASRGHQDRTARGAAEGYGISRSERAQGLIGVQLGRRFVELSGRDMAPAVGQGMGGKGYPIGGREG